MIAGFLRGSGALRRRPLSCDENADVGERVGFGCTGPKERSDCAKSGSEASRLIASSRDPLAFGGGRTVGPGCDCAADGGACCGAMDVVAGLWAKGVPAELVGYLRAAEPTAREALDVDEPIV